MAFSHTARATRSSSVRTSARQTVRYAGLALFLLAFALIEVLIGGTRLLFSLPSYGLLALVSILTCCSLGRQTELFPDWPCLVSTMVFFGYVLVRATTSPVEYLARADLFMVLAALMVYIFFATYFIKSRERFWLIGVLLVFGLANTALGILQYVRGAELRLLPFLEPASYSLRATGFYICPNHLAGFLEVAALTGLSAACWSRGPVWLRIVAGYGAFMCLVGVVLTGSRAGFLSASVGLAAFAVLSLKALRRDVMAGRKWGLISALLLLLIGVVFAGARFTSSQVFLKSRWEHLLTGEEARGEIWQTAIEQFKSAPVLGTGSGTFQYQERFYRKPSQISDSVYAHNDYLQLLAEYGALGMAGLLFFLVTHLRHGMRTVRSLVSDRPDLSTRLQSNRLALTIGALCVVSAYVVHSFFDFNLHIPANTLLLAAVFGFLANPGMRSPSAPELQSKFGGWVKLAAPALGLWLAIKGLPTLPGEHLTEQSRQQLVHSLQTPNPVTPPAAVESATRALSYDARNPFTYLYLGQALVEVSQTADGSEERSAVLARAADAFQKGLILFPQDRELLLGTGATLDALQLFEEAAPFYRRAVEWNPNSSRVRALYAAHLHAAKKWDQAEAEYKASLALYWNASAHEGLQKLTSYRATAQPP